MQNNFDLKGYLRNNKLLNESLGGYVDLKPLKEMDLDSFVGAQKDTANFQAQFDKDINELIAYIKGEDSDTRGGYKVIGSDYVQQAWEAFSKIPFNTVEEKVFAELMAKNLVQDTRGEYDDNIGNESDEEDLGYDSADSMIFDKGWQYDDDDINELEKPENIYADDEELSINYNSPDSDRMMDLGGDVIEQNIISLLDDGFDPEDVLEFCKHIIDAHSQATAQGNKF